MNLPSIPTDNLYKFCAVTGVVLLLFGTTFPIQKIFDTQDDLDLARTESKIFMVQAANLSEELVSLEYDVNSLEKDITEAKTNPDTANFGFLRSSSSAAAIKLAAVKEKRHELAIFNMRQQGNLDHLKNLFQRLWLYVSAGAIFIISGLNLAFFGFSRWYYRVQKPADDLLLSQNG